MKRTLCALALVVILSPVVGICGNFKPFEILGLGPQHTTPDLYRALEEGDGALEEVLDPGFPFRLLQVRLLLEETCTASEYLAIFPAPTGEKPRPQEQYFVPLLPMEGGITHIFDCDDEPFWVLRPPGRVFFYWPNSEKHKWGMEVLFRRLEEEP